MPIEVFVCRRGELSIHRCVSATRGGSRGASCSRSWRPPTARRARRLQARGARRPRGSWALSPPPRAGLPASPPRPSVGPGPGSSSRRGSGRGEIDAGNGDRFQAGLGADPRLRGVMVWDDPAAHTVERAGKAMTARGPPPPSAAPPRSRHQPDGDGCPGPLASDCHQPRPRGAPTGDRPDILIPSTQPNTPVTEPCGRVRP
jgi:hypothetical protein